MRKSLLSISIIATSILSTGCGINIKPESSQIYENFNNRRPPRENQLILDGAYSDKKITPSSEFKGFSGNVDRLKKDDSNGNVYDPSPYRSNKNIDVNTDKHSSINAPFFERLKRKFSFDQTKVAFNKPTVEHREVVEQGDGGGESYSYYDLADDIPKDSYIDISEQLVVAEARGASRALVEVPQDEQIDELKLEADSYSEPQLKNIPKRSNVIDQYQNKKITLPIQNQTNVRNSELQPKINSHVNHKDKLFKPDDSKSHQIHHHNYTESNGRHIKDTSARIEYNNGREILTGSLGSIKSTKAY